MCCNKNKIKKPLCLTNYAILLCFQNLKYWCTWIAPLNESGPDCKDFCGRTFHGHSKKT